MYYIPLCHGSPVSYWSISEQAIKRSTPSVHLSHHGNMEQLLEKGSWVVILLPIEVTFSVGYNELGAFAEGLGV